VIFITPEIINALQTAALDNFNELGLRPDLQQIAQVLFSNLPFIPRTAMTPATPITPTTPLTPVTPATPTTPITPTAPATPGFLSILDFLTLDRD
jgi:hypothetical protein